MHEEEKMLAKAMTIAKAAWYEDPPASSLIQVDSPALALYMALKRHLTPQRSPVLTEKEAEEMGKMLTERYPTWCRDHAEVRAVLADLKAVRARPAPLR